MTEAEAESVCPEKYGYVKVGGPVAGPVHDRGLMALTAFFAAFATSRYLASKGMPADDLMAIAFYLAAAAVGYQVGKRTPAEYRGSLQIAVTTTLSVLGAGYAAGL